MPNQFDVALVEAMEDIVHPDAAHLPPVASPNLGLAMPVCIDVSHGSSSPDVIDHDVNEFVNFDCPSHGNLRAPPKMIIALFERDDEDFALFQAENPIVVEKSAFSQPSRADWSRFLE